MEQGHEDNRFQTVVDKNFYCPICMNVLKDPVQCRGNEHYFCSPCIRRHLEQNRQSCPLCLEELTIETLRLPPRIVADYLSSLTISCDYAVRGCREVIQLGLLESHVANCGFSPVPCSNDGCLAVVNKQDLEQHEGRACGFKKVKCDDCGEVLPSSRYAVHGCVTRREIIEIKKNLTEMKGQLDRSLYVQEETMKEVRGMFAEMREEMKRLTTEANVIQQSVQNLRDINHHAEPREDFIVLGGSPCVSLHNSVASVERFTWCDRKWSQLQQMKETRAGAAAVVFENQVLVIGGIVKELITDSMKVMNMHEKPEQWVDFPAKLPLKCYCHKCVVYGNRLIVTGGMIFQNKIQDGIYEVLLVPPYSSRLLCRMEKKRCCHGIELFKDKIVIVGGITNFQPPQCLNSVVMYDLIKNECKELAPLPSYLFGMATVHWDDSMITIGGTYQHGGEPVDTVMAYDIKTGECKALPSTKTKRKGCTAIVSGNRIVVMGGLVDRDGNSTVVNSVEYFSFLSHSWEELSPMNETRAYASAV